MQPVLPRVLHFGPFRFNAETAELSRRGVKLRLQPQPASLLQLLLANPGQLVTRETIQRELWSDGTLVDYELGVNRCVRQLRSALGDNTEIPRYIRTVPKLGYCFVASVRRSEAAAQPSAANGLAVSPNNPPVTTPPVSVQPVEEQTSIAVLPFANLSGNLQDEYFGDGLAEEITNVLAQIGSLKVIARTSAFAFKGRNEDVRKIAEALGVNHVLEGSVRRLGMRIRVTAQLIRSSDGTHVSSKRYDCEHTDLFALQDEISADIARQFHVRLKAHRPASHHPGSYEAFLEGRFHWHKFTPAGFERALACYKRAITLDPTYGSAFTGMAEAYTTMVMDAGASAHELLPKAAEAARIALQLDDQDSGAHAATGLVAAMRDYDWTAAREHFHRAFQLGANTHARVAYVQWYLLPRGEIREALLQCDRVIADDPLLLVGRTAKATALLWARSYAEGIQCCQDALELDSRFAKAWQIKTYLLGLLNRHKEAMACAHGLIEILGPSHLSLFTLGLAHAAAGDRADADQVLARIDALPRGHAGSPTAIAGMCMLLNDVEGSVRWMAKAIEQRDPRALWMYAHPWADAVRDEPRYQTLMRRMHLHAAV
jgi:serine/threonine-protein kinase